MDIDSNDILKRYNVAVVLKHLNHFMVSYAFRSSESWMIGQLLRTEGLKVGRSSDSKTWISFIFRKFTIALLLLRMF